MCVSCVYKGVYVVCTEACTLCVHVVSTEVCTLRVQRCVQMCVRCVYRGGAGAAAPQPSGVGAGGDVRTRASEGVHEVR